MKLKTILIYYEQHGYGGVDTHMAHLINNWPCENDHIVILSNRDNEGIDFLKTKLTRKKNVDIQTIDMGEVNKDRRFLLRRLRFFWYRSIGIIPQFVKIFNTIKPDVLLSDNGGYPGGLTCFLAVIVGKVCKPGMRNFLLVHHAPGSGNKFIRVYGDFLAWLIKGLRIP